MSVNAIAVFNTTIRGTVSFHQCPKHQNAVVSFNLSGFEPNAQHGVHIHRYGILNLEKACDSTCDHYNPTGEMHGSIKLYGSSRHAGDLINNLKANSKGVFVYTYEDDKIYVQDIIGRSVVIHSGVDDLGRWRDDYSDPERQKGSSTTGNAGSRIACSVIGLAPSN